MQYGHERCAKVHQKVPRNGGIEKPIISLVACFMTVVMITYTYQLEGTLLWTSSFGCSDYFIRHGRQDRRIMRPIFGDERVIPATGFGVFTTGSVREAAVSLHLGLDPFFKTRTFQRELVGIHRGERFRLRGSALAKDADGVVDEGGHSYR